MMLNHWTAKICRLSCIVVMAVMTLTAASPAAVMAADVHAITISPDASPVARFAASELQQFLQLATGQRLPIEEARAYNPQGGRIYVGLGSHVASLTIDTQALYPDGYIIRSVDGNLVIAGDDEAKGAIAGFAFDPRQGRKGTLYGIYRFLETQYDIRWLWPGDRGQVVPTGQTLTMPAGLDITSRPAMAWRHLFLNGNSKLTEEEVRACYLWYLRQGMGISIGAPSSFAHSWRAHIGLNSNFDEHPEWYSLIKGKRTPFPVNRQGRVYAMGQQVCTSNPQVVDQFVQSIRSRYPKDSDAIVNLSPNDGSGFCECENCKALDHPELYGPDEGYQGINYSDRIFGFVSKIAAEVRKTHPNLRVGCFAYTYAREAPRALDSLSPNVVISHTQMIQQTNRDPRKLAEHRERLDAWLAKGNKIVLRDYFGYIGQAAAMTPLSKWMHDEITHAAKYPQQIMGFYSETTYSGMVMNHLDFHLMARLAWNPEADLDALKADYFKHGYGPAAKDIAGFYDTLETAYRSTADGQAAFLAGVDLWLTPQVVRDAQASLARAKQHASGDAGVTARIDTLGRMFDYTVALGELVNSLRTLTDAGLPVRLPGYVAQPAAKPPTHAQINQMIRHATQRYEHVLAIIESLEQHDNGIIHSADGFRRYTGVWRWAETLDEYRTLFADASQTPVTLPVVWQFRLDPQDQGVSEKWYAGPREQSQWKDIRIDDTWENQGYGQEAYDTPEGYNGKAWYRLDDVRINSASADYKTTLWLGAVDESCRVFVNGQFVGEAIYDPVNEPDGWKMARQFDITSAIKTDAPNTLAVQVIDQSGHGGIWKRAWLVTSSRDDTGSNRQTTLLHETFDDDAWQQRAARVNNHEGDKFAIVDKTLRFTTANGLPDGGCSITYVIDDVSGGSTLRLVVKVRTQNLQENAGLEKLWQRRPLAPSIRVIPYNAQRKAAIPAKEYPWVGLPFAESSDGWQKLVKVFKLPDDAKRITVTIFMNAKGEYHYDDLVVSQVQ